jgi:hypothetical protein
MTRRSGAAKALVEQPGPCLSRAQASPGPSGQSEASRTPSRRVHGSPHRPVRGAHLTSITARSRTVARSDAAALLSVTQCYGSQLSEVADDPDRRIFAYLSSADSAISTAQISRIGSAEGAGRVGPSSLLPGITAAMSLPGMRMATGRSSGVRSALGGSRISR